ncbi:MAG: phosphonate metabolism protein/1,5-bisphosphokinase (PRPP-forming) PhnN [Micrococcales bacterium]|nr:phosphonate metabolism protein/1,5-bisphosphokinase (PRPP-forming) PhnN [Micrococcales bacterium]
MSSHGALAAEVETRPRPEREEPVRSAEPVEQDGEHRTGVRLIGPGVFVAVVGPSGAGKDSVIGCASESLGALVTVPRRVVTRPPGPGEDHLPATEREFAEVRASGGYACHWDAHGLRYGLPTCVDEVVRAGGVVLANVSRTALDELERRYADFRVVLVTASDEVRARRLAQRGRESHDDVARRVARLDPAPGRRVDLVIVNDGALAEAGDALTAFLRAAAGRDGDR